MTGRDGLACGWQSNTEETRYMLCHWAQTIIVMETYMAEFVPEEFKHKVLIYDVGPDIWSNPLHEDLIAKVTRLIEADITRWPAHKVEEEGTWDGRSVTVGLRGVINLNEKKVCIDSATAED